MSTPVTPERSRQPQPSTVITPEQRAAFLRSQGWDESLAEEVRLALEATWTPEAIEMARALGFAYRIHPVSSVFPLPVGAAERPPARS